MLLHSPKMTQCFPSTASVKVSGIKAIKRKGRGTTLCDYLRQSKFSVFSVLSCSAFVSDTGEAGLWKKQCLSC